MSLSLNYVELPIHVCLDKLDFQQENVGSSYSHVAKTSVIIADIMQWVIIKNNVLQLFSDILVLRSCHSIIKTVASHWN